MKVFIYVLIDPDGTVRYVGKSNEHRIEKRLYEHCQPTRLTANTYKNNWIRSLLRNGIRPILKVIEECTEDTYAVREKYWVEYYRQQLGHKLTNGTVGGEGVAKIVNRVITDEQKSHISQTLKRRYITDAEYMMTNCSNAGKKSRGIKRKFKFEQTSGEVGISFSKRHDKWRAYAWMNGKHVHIGIFLTEQEAIAARNKFFIEHNMSISTAPSE